jgi:hypothetical protein
MRAYDEPYSKLSHKASHTNSLQCKAAALLTLSERACRGKDIGREDSQHHSIMNGGAPLLLEAVEVGVA